VKARKVKKLDPAGPLGENAARIVRTRLEELRSFAPRALERDQLEAQHDMRIAAKRLRYVLELTGFCFGKPGNTARRRARDLQDILGELHDCDVMLPRVRAHLAELQASDARAVRRRAQGAPDLDPKLAAAAPNRTAYRGLDLLAVYLRARREVLFERFVAFWSEQQQRGTWVALERALQRAASSGRAPKRRSAPVHTDFTAG
jgi:CHAD domain